MDDTTVRAGTRRRPAARRAVPLLGLALVLVLARLARADGIAPLLPEPAALADARSPDRYGPTLHAERAARRTQLERAADAIGTWPGPGPSARSAADAPAPAGDRAVVPIRVSQIRAEPLPVPAAAVDRAPREPLDHPVGWGRVLLVLGLAIGWIASRRA